MSLTLLLPWFPILLGVGVGGRLLGRQRGIGLGLLCALFWIVLSQAAAGVAMWQQPWTAASVLLGAVAIAAMGAWAGEVRSLDAESRPDDVHRQAASDGSQATLERLSTAMDRFEAWLGDHRDDPAPWSAFGEFVRAVLYDCCRATHVKLYRLSPDGRELTSLRDLGTPLNEGRVSARDGILGHVVTSGRSYFAGDGAQGELLNALAQGTGEAPAWCFAVSRGARRLGAVVAGHLEAAPPEGRLGQAVLQRWVAQCWILLEESLRARAAGQYDPVSGLLTRPHFLPAAATAVDESLAAGEPVAVAVIALEGLRGLNDAGCWDIADEVVRAASEYLRRKVRADDRVGRFDGSRFILLLRRVDSQLAMLIVEQIAAQLAITCGGGPSTGSSVASNGGCAPVVGPRVNGSPGSETAPKAGARGHRPPTGIRVRCGLAGSGTQRIELRPLIARALRECQRARLEQLAIASDLRPSMPLAEAVS